jgi:hypothetical protein
MAKEKIVTVCPECGHSWNAADEKVFSMEELKKMSLSDYIENRDKIMRQLEQKKIVKPKVI